MNETQGMQHVVDVVRSTVITRIKRIYVGEIRTSNWRGQVPVLVQPGQPDDEVNGYRADQVDLRPGREKVERAAGCDETDRFAPKVVAQTSALASKKDVTQAEMKRRQSRKGCRCGNRMSRRARLCVGSPMYEERLRPGAPGTKPSFSSGADFSGMSPGRHGLSNAQLCGAKRIRFGGAADAADAVGGGSHKY
ncbi:uncharacterized protein BDR25DRAFT_314136 [Lindgomyces ingoldianus]|uniref:Uncharacterized protein n=1 Tax=Lindgomyces ingoldianus TaxID=673940 RepID=A0ACB6QY00_9PLEO|nr:uncharacterized protein BDR25DRAFT_314136 [Lindgomyces ingoldianus]KAF2470960.1 hypothetical protein BDR25DRAFT_314136 [Lindgomyces ingoldianus]